MCTYRTERLSVDGSAKGVAQWLTVTDASVSLDHPQATVAEHTVNLDFLNPARGPSARVAVELSEESARALVAAITTLLAQG
jgi:hypothetical protein